MKSIDKKKHIFLELKKHIRTDRKGRKRKTVTEKLNPSKIGKKKKRGNAEKTGDVGLKQEAHKYKDFQNIFNAF